MSSIMIIQLGMQPWSFLRSLEGKTNLRCAMCETISSPDKVASRVELEKRVSKIFVGGLHTIIIA